MSEMLEQIAEAIWREDHRFARADWRLNVRGEERERYLAKAKAVLLVLRNPDPAMISEGAGSIHFDGDPYDLCVTVWRAMIDGALEPRS